MFSAERIRKIKELLLEYQEVDVNTLCDCFSASVSTIRRDLDKLEAEGFLQRVHGGAVLRDEVKKEGSRETAKEEGEEEAEQIARLVVKIIAPDDIIFLGGGHVCGAVANLICNDFRGTVYTNNLEVVETLCHIPRISVIVLGGRISCADSNVVTDADPEHCCTSNIFVSKAFFTVYGVTKQHGYFVRDIAERRLIETLSQNAVEAYMLLETYKTERIGAVRLGDIGGFSRVISLPFIAEDYKQIFFDKGVTLYTSMPDL